MASVASAGRPTVRILVLATVGQQPPDEELRRLIAEDAMPDSMIAQDAFGAASLDDRDLAGIPGVRGRTLRRLPVQLALAIEAWRRRRDFDVVLSWTERVGFSLAALLALSPRRRVGHIAVFTWPVGASGSSRLRRSAKDVGFPVLARRGIDRLAIPSSRQRELVAERWRYAPGRILPAKTAIDTRFWSPREGAGDTVCSVGREMRDYETLIEALRGLDIPCHIATGASFLNPVSGSDDPRASNVGGRELPASVTTGRKSVTELRELHARSRFVVIPLMPTNTDNGATAILEAMAMGRPVITTATEGRTEILEDDVNCVLVPARDVGALRTAIEELWNDPQRCARLGARAREQVLAEHSIEQWLAAIRAAAEELASAASRR
jgi:glycosyltransferase involved in cell wall biosynthesis